MATNTNINFPQSEFLDAMTRRPAREWMLWLMSPSVISINSSTALGVTSGGTGLSTIPTAGQLLIGNNTGYTLATLTPGAGIGVANTPGAITLANTGVLSWSGGLTGLTPATATTGAVTLAGTLGAGYGGTGLASYAVGDLLYASGTTALSQLADVATGNALVSGGVATAPAWGKIGLTTHVSGILPIANGGTNGTAAPTAGAVPYGTGTAYAFTAIGTAGQVLTSAAAGTPTWTTPTTGTVTAVSVTTANGFAGTSSGGATPALTLSTSITGVLKGNGTAMSAATAATDYVAPSAYASVNGLTMATARLLGRTTAATGAAEEISVAGGLTLAAGVLTGTSGTVTSVTGTAPVVSSGGTTPAISMPVATTSVNGYLSSTDWTTFNGKQPAGTYVNSVSGTTGRVTSTGGVTPVIDLASGIATPGTTGSATLIPVVTIETYGRVTGITTAANPQGTVTSVTGTAPVVSSGGATPAISMAAATSLVNGYLTSTDWTTFNNKGSGSVTSVSFTGGLITVATATTTPALTVAGTSGGIPYFSSASTWASSAALTQYGVVYGGGAGATPVATAAGTTGQILTATTSGAPTWSSTYAGTVTSVAALTLGTTGTDLSSTVATGTTTPVITLQVPTASASNRGALSSTDWSTFNAKQPVAAPVTKTADFTVAATDIWLINNKAASTCTVTLPTASTYTGRKLTIKNLQAFTVVSASSNVVPIDSTSAGTAILLDVVGNWATLVSDGTNWVIMQQASNNNLLLE